MNFKRRKMLKALDSGSSLAKEKCLLLFHFFLKVALLYNLVFSEQKCCRTYTEPNKVCQKTKERRLTWNISSVLGNHSVSKVQTTGWSRFCSLENSLRNTTTEKKTNLPGGDISSWKAAVLLTCTFKLSTIICLLNQLQMEHQISKINTNVNSFWPPYKNKFPLDPWPADTWCLIY